MNRTFKIIFYGLLAALFFSSTFIMNKYIANEGGHWFWSGFLRYIYMLIILALGFYFFKGYSYLKSIILEFFTNYIFWIIAGSIGFGIFYAIICYVANSSPAWVVATTWQFTIIASLIILYFFGKKLSKSTWAFVILIFLGIFLINFTYLEIDDITNQVLNIFLIIIASFAYPIGNQLVWEVQKGRFLTNVKQNILKNTFAKVFLLSLGSLPFWLVLSMFFEVGLPSYSQYTLMFAVAIFSGIIATSLFLYARAQATTPQKIALVDATQSGEVLFTLFIEIILLSAILPSSIGLFGILIVLVGLIGLTSI